VIRVLLLLTEFLEARIATEIIVLAKRATSQPSRCFSFPKVLSAFTALMPFLYGSYFFRNNDVLTGKRYCDKVTNSRPIREIESGAIAKNDNSQFVRQGSRPLQ